VHQIIFLPLIAIVCLKANSPVLLMKKRLKTRITSKANTIKMAIQYPLRLELDKGKSRGT
jgi:hypothetical protein